RSDRPIKRPIRAGHTITSSMASASSTSLRPAPRRTTCASSSLAHEPGLEGNAQRGRPNPASASQESAGDSASEEGPLRRGLRREREHVFIRYPCWVRRVVVPWAYARRPCRRARDDGVSVHSGL